MNIREPVKKILCIDEDPALSVTAKEIIDHSFGAKGVRVFHALTGESGLDQMKESVADIVLCNIDLPGKKGFEICREIRKQYPQVSVVLMSDYEPEEDTASKAREAGADSYLSKPIKKGELLFVVNSVFRATQQDNAIHEKNQKLEEALGQLKTFHKQVADLNSELQAEKHHLVRNLQEVTDLNKQLEGKNLQITSMVAELGHRFESTETLLVSIIELRQPEHAGHQERVAEISTFIAEKMGLNEYQVRNIKTAARLHELGIAALPTREKRVEALDEGKNRSATNHPLVGEMLLKGLAGFELVANIVRHLHENVDGSGFPDNCYGDRIPIGSRIVSAASYYDHYRISNPDDSPAQALAVLDALVGKFFDEQVLNYLGEYVQTQMDPEEGQTFNCSVFALVADMELASDIFSESGINLLRKGTVLDSDTLSKIMKFHAVDPIVGDVKIKQPT